MEYSPEFFKKINEENGYENFKFWYNLFKGVSSPQNKTNRILIFRPDGIGDFILFSPLLDGIRKAYPKKSILLMAMQPVAQLAKDSNLVDDIIIWNRLEYERRGIYWRYFLKKLNALEVDTIFYPCVSREANIDEMVAVVPALNKIGIRSNECNLALEIARYNERLYSHILTINYFNKHEIEINEQIAEKMGLSVGNYLTLWDKNAIRKIDSILKEFPQGKIAIVAPGSRQSFKCWPKEKYLKVINLLQGEYVIFIVGDKNDSSIANWIYNNVKDRTRIYLATGQFSFRETCALINKSDLFLGNDSALAHVAVLLNIRGHVIVGGAHFGRFFPYPWKTSIKVHTHRMSCFGCNWKCYNRSYSCIRLVEIADKELII